MAECNTFQTLDLYLSSFLSLSGVSTTLEVNNNGKVIFVFPANDDLYRLMANYNNNVNIPVTDFVTSIKTLRGQMLSMRGGQK